MVGMSAILRSVNAMHSSNAGSSAIPQMHYMPLVSCVRFFGGRWKYMCFDDVTGSRFSCNTTFNVICVSMRFRIDFLQPLLSMRTRITATCGWGGGEQLEPIKWKLCFIYSKLNVLPIHPGHLILQCMSTRITKKIFGGHISPVIEFTHQHLPWKTRLMTSWAVEMWRQQMTGVDRLPSM